MKKIFSHLFATVLLSFSSLIFFSCGSKKIVYQPYPNYTDGQPRQTVTSNNGRVEEEIDDCEKESLQIEGGLLKAYGSATDYDKDFARQTAAANARAQMASDIKALVNNILKNYRATTRSNAATTSSADVQQDITSIAEEVITQTAITCSKRYRLADGRYECTVCISMVKEIEDEVGGLILTDDQKLGVRFDAEQFRKAYQEELERYRLEKKNQ